jgi:ABC-2 type transport system ATP-binding protein
MTTQPVIKVRNLSKDFKSKHALLDVNLEIPTGSVVGVLGPNGCGKTTLFKHLIGLLQPSRGGVETFGTDAARLDASQLGKIGYVSQQSELIDHLTVRETINFTEAHYLNWDKDLAQRLLNDFKLNDNSNVGSLSVGQKQRLSIVLGVSHRPELLILDEPAASLDPVVRQDFLDLLMELIQQPERTILISSHILTDVQKIIDKVLIIDEGMVHCFQDLDDLREEYYSISLRSLSGALPTDIQLTGIKYLDHQGATAVVKLHNPDADLVKREVADLNCQADISRLDFEDIYRLIVSGK